MFGAEQEALSQRTTQVVCHGDFICRCLWQRVSVSGSDGPAMPLVLWSLYSALGRDDCSRELAGSFEVRNVKGGDSPHKAIPIITGGWGTGPEQVSGRTPHGRMFSSPPSAQDMLCDGGVIIYTLITVSS